jgi:hypothetical protein
VQEEGLGRFFGAVRFCYNLLVEKYQVVGQAGVSLKELRATIAAGPAAPSVAASSAPVARFCFLLQPRACGSMNPFSIMDERGEVVEV